jgi:hypothetical protein
MALRTLQFRLKFDNIFVSFGQNASFALSLFCVVVGAVGYDLGDFVDPSVDFVASSPLDFVVLLPPRQVLLNPAS